MPALDGCLDDCRTSTTMHYKIASTLKERASAFRLVYESYLHVGACRPNAHRMRVTPYQLLPTTDILIAQCHGETIFTMSLVSDGRLGLPMEAVYHDEVETRRQRGLALGEVACLADRRRDLRGFLPIFLGLSRLLAQCVAHRGLDGVLMNARPRHSSFYKKVLAFVQIAEERPYPGACNHLGVALSLSLERARCRGTRVCDILFGQLLPDAQLKPHPMPDCEKDFFRSMIDPVFLSAPPAGLACFGENPEGTLVGAETD